MRCRASETFCALLILEKSGDPSARLGKLPSADATGITGAAAGAWPLRGAGREEVDIVTFGLALTAVPVGAGDVFTALPVPA